MTRRPSTDKTAYHDGTRWRSAVTDPATEYGTANAVGPGLLAATLARFLNSPQDSWLIDIAVKSVQQVLLYENQPDTYWSNGDFTLSVLGKMLVMLNGMVDQAMMDDWIARYITACSNFRTGATDAVGGSHSGEASWYTNGNREIGELTAMWCAWKLTGSSTWQTIYEGQLSWLVGPTSGGFVPAMNGGSVFGWAVGTTPTQPDGSDGTGWFREAGANGFYDVTDASHFMDGLDWEYTGLQIQYMLQLWLLSNDSRLLPYLNMMNNVLDPRLNTTTWVIDATAGSRHTVTYAHVFAIKHALVWKGGRADITGATLASQYNNMENQVVNYARAPSPGSYRNFGMDIPSYLMAMDAWPGH